MVSFVPERVYDQRQECDKGQERDPGSDLLQCEVNL
jgi:hypothetical protein